MRYAVEDVPLAKAFQRIVRGQHAFVPELDVAALRIHKTAARVPPERPAGTALSRTHLPRLRPPSSVIVRVSNVCDIHGIRAGPSFFEGNHLAAAGPRVEGIGHHSHAGGGRRAEDLAAH